MNERLYDSSLEATLLSSLLYCDHFSADELNENIFYSKNHQSVLKSLKLLENLGECRNDAIICDIMCNKFGMDKHIAESTLSTVMGSNPTTSISHIIDRLTELQKLRSIYLSMSQVSQMLETGAGINEIESKMNSISEKLLEEDYGNFFEIHNSKDIPAREPEFVCSDFIPIVKKSVTIFSADGGMGKTFLLSQIALRYLLENQTEKAFLWFSEDDIGITKSRLNDIIKDIFQEGSGVMERLDISGDPTFHIIYEENRTLKINPLFYKMKRKLSAYKFIVLDPLIAFYGADENSNTHARRFMQLFTHWALKEDKILIFIHHTAKYTTASRGAGDLTNAVRTVYQIDTARSRNGLPIPSLKRTVTLFKDNYKAARYFGGMKKEIKVFPREELAIGKVLSNNSAEEYDIT